MFGALSIFISFLIIICSIIAGVLIAASGQSFLAIREIALNTRKENIIGSNYKALEIIGSIILVIGILVAIGGVGIGLIGIITPFSGTQVEISKTEKPIKETKNFGEKQAYINKIAIRNLRVSKSTFGSPGVFGEIKNVGDRTLKKVEITIYFLDKSGKPIFEEIYHPVLVTDFSLGDNEPLKSNYSRKFGYSTDDVPSEWAKKVRAKITNIEFE